MARKKLPTGIQTFSDIREGRRYYYVDKTRFAKRLIDGDKHNFLSRPRRFGKSLFVDTLKNLFEGEKKLFNGLYIYDKWDWTVKYPVVRLDFAGGEFTESGQLRTYIMEQLTDLEDENGVKPKHKSASGRLAYLVKELAKEKGQRVVILVDEHDKPIFDALETPGTEGVARANRNTLRALYGNIKRCERYIQFSFLTGVTKFSHTSLFSGLNNLNDITLEPEFSSICGYTDHDIDTVFAKVLGDLDREAIREWYNGYNWCGRENVYNPYSILKLFSKRKLKSWWFPTGTPTFLINELKKHGGIGTLRLRGMSAGESLLSTFDIGNMKIPALLFQTGYLTIDREEEVKNRTRYILDYPNLEVRQSLHWSLIDALTEGPGGEDLSTDLREALLSADLDAVEAQFHAAFAGIPYEFYNKNKLAEYEGHYANVVYSSLMGTGLPVQVESSTNLARIDMVVETSVGIYVFELKVLKKGVKKGAAMKQIHEREYADKFRARGVPVYLVGVEFDPAKRNIENFEHETIQPARGRSKRARKPPVRGRAKSARKKRNPRL